MAGIINYLSSAVFGKEEGAAEEAGSHGHTHGGEPCHGHGAPSPAAARAAAAAAAAAAEAHGHSHGGRPCDGDHGPQQQQQQQQHQQEQAHGHTHGGRPCHGHGHQQHAHEHAAPQHGHTHGGQPCHGHGAHGHGAPSLPPLPPHTGPLRNSGTIEPLEMMHMLLNFRIKAAEPEVKKAVKGALGTEGKPQKILEGVLFSVAEGIGYEGPYALKFVHENQEGPSQTAQFCRSITLFSDLLVDEQRLSPEAFAQKLHAIRMEQMRAQMAQHAAAQAAQAAQAAPAAPQMTPEEKAKFIESAREAQKMLASLTPRQRAMFAAAAQNQMAAVSSENPSIAPQERARMVNEKMGQLQRMIKEGGFESPQLIEALRKLNVMVDAASQRGSGADAAEAPSRAPAPSTEDDDIGTPTTMDRS